MASPIPETSGLRLLLLVVPLIFATACAAPDVRPMPPPSPAHVAAVPESEVVRPGTLPISSVESCESRLDSTFDAHVHVDLDSLRGAPLGAFLFDATGSLRPLFDSSMHVLIGFKRTNRSHRAMAFIAAPPAMETAMVAYPECPGRPSMRCDGWLRQLANPAAGCVIVTVPTDPFDAQQFVPRLDEMDDANRAEDDPAPLDVDPTRGQTSARDPVQSPFAGQPHSGRAWVEAWFASPQQVPGGYLSTMHFTSFQWVHLQLVPREPVAGATLSVRVSGLGMGVDGYAENMLDRARARWVNDDEVLAGLDTTLVVDRSGSSAALELELTADAQLRLAARVLAVVAEMMDEESAEAVERAVRLASWSARRSPRAVVEMLTFIEPAVIARADARLGVEWRAAFAEAIAHGGSPRRAVEELDELLRAAPHVDGPRVADEPRHLGRDRDQLVARIGDRARTLQRIADATNRCGDASLERSIRHDHCASAMELALELGDRARIAVLRPMLERVTRERAGDASIRVENAIGHALLEDGRVDEARAYVSALFVRRARDVEFGQPSLIPLLTELYVRRARSGRAEAADVVVRLTAMLDELIEVDDASTEYRILLVLAIGDALEAAGRSEDARRRLSEVEQLVERTHAPESWFAMRVELGRLRVLARMGDDVEVALDALRARVRVELLESSRLRRDVERGVR